MRAFVYTPTGNECTTQNNGSKRVPYTKTKRYDIRRRKIFNVGLFVGLCPKVDRYGIIGMI